MPKFYCEYCGIYLTHSSPSGRGQHAKGRKHINNRIEYYKQIVDDINKENQDKMKQMQVTHPAGGQFQPQLSFPQAFPHAHPPQMLLQLQHLSAGGISQMQINSTQPKPGQTAPPQQQMPMIPPPQLYNMPMGAPIPGMMPMRQPPGMIPMAMKPMPPFGSFPPSQPIPHQAIQPPQNLQPPQTTQPPLNAPPQNLPSQPFNQPLPGFVSMPINPDRQVEMVPKEE